MSYYHMELECTRCKNRIHVEVNPLLPDIGTIISGSCYSEQCKDIKETGKHTILNHLSG